MSEPTYSNRQWHYPENSEAEYIITHALRFALRDYERMSKLSPHPFTQGPRALHDALKALRPSH